jgi:hypothetical protein
VTKTITKVIMFYRRIYFIWVFHMSKRVIEEAIEGIESELGVVGAVILAKGSVACEEKCVRIFVEDLESFKKILVALVKQGISTGGLPIVVLENERVDTVEFSIVDYIDGLIVTYTTRRE